MLFAGQTAWNNAKPILSQLVSDLTSNALNVVPLVTGDINQLTQVLQGAGKRDVVDFLINSFGLGQVWQTIQQSGQNLLGQFQGKLNTIEKIF